jgi:Uncharacterized conserved protein (COG2071)
MFSFLKNHPFPVEAHFESSLVLTFAVLKSEIQDHIQPCLELDTWNDQWAFIAVALVQTKDLRPKGLPRIMGNNFFLIGYRIFVKCKNQAGKRLRGLYILKSETDSKLMEILGNVFTHYRYTTTDIHQLNQNSFVQISSIHSGFKVCIKTGESQKASLPSGSPFTDWKEARRFAGPLPFTFSFNPQTRKVLIIEGVRENWTPQPVEVVNYHFSFLEEMKLKSITLANAFIIQDIPYYWKKGKLELWKEV